MHESRSDHVVGQNRSDDSRSDDRAAIHLPAPGPSGDLTVLERVEAFRDLIRHGHSLLGEVVSYCRDAEAAVAQLAAEKADVDRVRADLETARQRADSEAEATRKAMAQVDAQRRELNEIRTELMRARDEVARFQREQTENAESLSQSLRHAQTHQAELEQELERARAQASASRGIDSRLGKLDALESKLRMTERELNDTRQALENERGRRDRAIALIRPKQAVG